MRGLTRQPVAILVALLGLSTGAASAADLHLSTPERSPVRWSEWLAEHGPCAVLVWASWAPGAGDSLRAARELDGIAASRDLDLVIVAVQEEFDAAGQSLAGGVTPWLHDRHGGILKEYRLIAVPSLIVVDRQGQLLARADDPTPAGLARALSAP